MPATTVSREHFLSIFPKLSQMGAPLRPSADDTAVVQRIVADLGPAANVVVLGLTPETMACTWPTDVRLTAVDHSPSMMAALWPPPHRPANSQVIMADWQTLPIQSGTIDLAVGDGCYMLQSYPEGFQRFTHEVCRVLRCGGRFVIRVFLRPEQPESVADIAHALASGKIGSVHAFKLRLLAALHRTTATGCRMDAAWQVWRTMPSLPATCAGNPGWSTEAVAGIERWQGMQAHFFMPTLTEFRQGMGQSLREVECSLAHYELADRCPTFILARQ